MKRFSIITVCLNVEGQISDTIASVLSQTCMDFEYIIKDGVSKDGTVSIAQSFAPAFAERGIPYRVISQPDKGVYDAMNQQVPVAIEPMTPQDAATTTKEPRWQTDWTSEYISKGKFDIYGLKTQIGELVALGAYEISEDVVTVHIVYMESQAQSNPTLCERPKYHGIGRALIAYGIKLSVDAGFNGDVTLDAKTPELARHYERDFRALLIPGRERGAAPRYLICDEAARDIFVSYLEEG